MSDFLDKVSDSARTENDLENLKKEVFEFFEAVYQAQESEKIEALKQQILAQAQKGAYKMVGNKKQISGTFAFTPYWHPSIGNNDYHHYDQMRKYKLDVVGHRLKDKLVLHNAWNLVKEGYDFYGKKFWNTEAWHENWREEVVARHREIDGLAVWSTIVASILTLGIYFFGRLATYKDCEGYMFVRRKYEEVNATFKLSKVAKDSIERFKMLMEREGIRMTGVQFGLYDNGEHLKDLDKSSFEFSNLDQMLKTNYKRAVVKWGDSKAQPRFSEIKIKYVADF
ncbi:MAG: hypothetical protein IJW51_07940 [Clostridia bacterium]|nr:hypothetical protein [Clostridia bacterium]